MVRTISFLLFIFLALPVNGVEIQYPDDENGKVLKNMSNRGINLDREYEIDFFHFFKNEKSAVDMVREINMMYENVKASIYINDVANGFDVYVSAKIYPTHSNISSAELLFAEIAEKYNGKSDGWGFESEYISPIKQHN